MKRVTREKFILDRDKADAVADARLRKIRKDQDVALRRQQVAAQKEVQKVENVNTLYAKWDKHKLQAVTGAKLIPPQPLFPGIRPHLALDPNRSEEHTSELQSLMRISYAVFCLKKKKHTSMYSNSSAYR